MEASVHDCHLLRFIEEIIESVNEQVKTHFKHPVYDATY